MEENKMVRACDWCGCEAELGTLKGTHYIICQECAIADAGRRRNENKLVKLDKILEQTYLNLREK